MKLFQKLTATAMRAATAMLAAGLLIPGAHADEPADSAELDRLLATAQQMCPVSGIELGSHGKPIKAKAGKMNLFLCCRGCLGKKISRENWAKVLENLATAQKICPVMKKPLPKNPKSVVVQKRIVFVCCPPCVKKVKADPEKYLAVVNEQLKKNVGLQE